MKQDLTKQKGVTKMRGQVATGFGVLVVVFASIAAVLFIFSQIRETERVVYEGAVPQHHVIYEEGPANLAEIPRDILNKQNEVLKSLGATGEGETVAVEENLNLFRAVYFPPLPAYAVPSEWSVEIRSVDIDAAKAAAEQWFLNQGLDVCRLNVSFWLNAEVREALPDGTVFDPVPSLCR